jgi:hypothetical protein
MIPAHLCRIRHGRRFEPTKHGDRLSSGYRCLFEGGVDLRVFC